MADFGKFIEDVYALAGQTESEKFRPSIPAYVNCCFCPAQAFAKHCVGASLANGLEGVGIFRMYECASHHRSFILQDVEKQ